MAFKFLHNRLPNKRYLGCLLGILLFYILEPGYCQNNNDHQSEIYSSHQALINKYENDITQVISFLEKIYNTLGSEWTTDRDKNTILNSSYLKLFRDPHVQIEDDLFLNRSTVLLKDVQSYLQDIDIFYQSVQFDFEILDRSVVTNIENKQFFKIVVNQSLSGITTNGKPMNFGKIRHIEIEINDELQDLKISSIYSKISNDNQSLNEWWNDLSFEWKVIFQRAINAEKRPNSEQLKKMISLEKLDVSYNKFIEDLEPLTMVKNLRNIDLSHTNVSNILALRNTKNLETLNLSHTLVRDISVLKFTPQLRFLFIENTKINDIQPLYQLKYLERVMCKGSPIDETSIKRLIAINPNHVNVVTEDNENLTWWNSLEIDWRKQFSTKIMMESDSPSTSDLTKIQSLESINLNGSKNIKDLLPLFHLIQLKELNCAASGITTLDGIDSLNSLELIDISNTTITNIRPLLSLKSLKTLICENTPIPKSEIEIFKSLRPEVRLMNHYAAISGWWINVPKSWKDALTKAIGYDGPQPVPVEILYDIEKIQFLNLANHNNIKSLEPLRRLTELKALNLANTMQIKSLEPLEQLIKLEKLICSGNPIEDLTPISEHYLLKYLDIKNTPVSSLEPLSNLRQLEELDISATKVNNLKSLRDLQNIKRLRCYNTDINNISPLITLVNLQSLLCYNTKLTSKKVEGFRKIKPSCHVIFY